MILFLNKLYKINSIKDENNVIESSIEIDKTHPVFLGHFPGNPVVPGVCLIQMVKELLELTMKRSLKLSKASNIKFLAAWNPEIENIVKANINYTVSNELISVSAKLQGKERTYISLKAEFL